MQGGTVCASQNPSNISEMSSIQFKNRKSKMTFNFEFMIEKYKLKIKFFPNYDLI